MMKFVFENIVGKGENAGYQHVYVDSIKTQDLIVLKHRICGKELRLLRLSHSLLPKQSRVLQKKLQKRALELINRHKF